MHVTAQNGTSDLPGCNHFRHDRLPVQIGFVLRDCPPAGWHRQEPALSEAERAGGLDDSLVRPSDANWGSSGFSVLPRDPVDIRSLRPPCFADYDSSLTLQRHARADAHQGGSGAWTLRTYPPPVPHPNHVACTCDVPRRRFMGRTPWKTAHKWVPMEPVRCRASPSGFRPRPLVPGLFAFRARVILLPDGPTRSIQRFPVRGKVPPFPHPEPPLLFVVSTLKPDEPKLGSFGAIRPNDSSVSDSPPPACRTPPRCPASGNWLCFSKAPCRCNSP